MQIKKFTIGVRLSKPAFRLSSLSGTVIDELLSHVEKSKGSEKVFGHVETATDKTLIRLVGTNHTLSMSSRDIQYTVDNYEKTHELDSNKEISRFNGLLLTANKLLKLREIRRVGIVCEYRIDEIGVSPSRKLLETLTQFGVDGHPAKFQLQFEQRHPISSKTGIPDFSTDDFWNVIESFYDGTIDTEHEKDDAVILMLDVQRYYHPLLDDKFDNAIEAVWQRHTKQYVLFEKKLRTLGLIHGDKQS